MKKISIIILLLLMPGINLSAKPLAGVAAISWNTQRGMTLSSLLEEHIIAILNKDGLFNTIDRGIINRELSKFGCFEETCILGFAEKAGINLLIAGNVQDRDSYVKITLKSYAINRAMNGKLIYSFTVNIPIDLPIGSREFSLICEEHASSFIVNTMRSFRQDIRIIKTGDLYIANTGLKLTGTFPLYLRDAKGLQVKTGTIVIAGNKVAEPVERVIPPDSYIIIDFKKEADSLEKYYSARKKQIVFAEKSFYDTLYIALLTPFASASMPVASPFLGYYMNNDWAGLGLWMVNAPAYLYMEARGFINSPSKLRDKKENISRDDKALNYFAWYMASAGGLPLFIDSYAHSYLRQGSYFTGDTRLLGNNATATYLSLVCNGGGMFYRGNRPWGYFYFHLNNILLYTTLREFASPEKYNPVTGDYEKGEPGNRKKTYCMILAVSKTIELVHTLFTPDRINNGTLTDEYIIPSPLITFDENSNPSYGIEVTFHY